MKKLSKTDMSKMTDTGTTSFQTISNEMKSNIQQSKLKEFVNEARRELNQNHSIALVLMSSPGSIVGPQWRERVASIKRRLNIVPTNHERINFMYDLNSMFGVRLPTDLRERIDREANRTFSTASAITRRAVHEYLKPIEESLIVPKEPEKRSWLSQY